METEGLHCLLLLKVFVLWTILSFHFWNCFLNRIFRVALLFIYQGSVLHHLCCATLILYYIIQYFVKHFFIFCRLHNFKFYVWNHSQRRVLSYHQPFQKSTIFFIIFELFFRIYNFAFPHIFYICYLTLLSVIWSDNWYDRSYSAYYFCLPFPVSMNSSVQS